MFKNNTPYSRINNSIDVLIKKHGSEKTADFIESISITGSLSFDKVNIDLQKFIFAEVIKQFHLKPSLFFASQTEPYKNGRMSCIYFYNHYCKYSPSVIKNKLNKIQKTITFFYGSISKIQGLMALPAINKEHYQIHMNVDEKIKQFISKK